MMDAGHRDRLEAGSVTDSIDTSEQHNGRTSSGGATGRGRRRRWLWWTLGIVVVVLAGLYVAGWFMTGNRVPSGTTVAGIEIGGLRTETARDRLESGLVDDAATPVWFSHEGQAYPLKPESSGLSIDVDETLREAGGGRSWNPVRMVDLLFGSAEEVEPVVTVNAAQLRSAVEDISAQVESEPTELSVTFGARGEPQVDEPVVGVDVDEDAAVAAADDAYLTSSEPLDLPVDDVQPSVTAAELDDARQQLIEPAVSAPVSLRLPGRVVRIPVETYAPALTMAPEDGRLVPAIDVDVLAPRLTAITRQSSVRPEDARIVLRGKSPVVIPAKPGVVLEPQEVADAILSVLTESGQARTAEAGTSTAQADFTTSDARALGIEERVSDFVTYYPYAEYRNINQGRAAELMDGTVLTPGETFSFNETVGERTVANGFVKGFIISNGVFAEELGGGVSQVVTTTYNAAFFAGLEDVEHKPHSFYIDRYPLGREATVAFPTVDLKFSDDTPYGVLINAWVVPATVSTPGEMHVEMYSTKYWDITAGVSERYDFTPPRTRYDRKDTCVANTGYRGFEVDVFRYFRKSGSDELVTKEIDHVTYTPSDSVVCSARPRRDRPR